MATASIPFNPQIQTNAAGTFATSFAGLVQGFEYPDPAVRNFLAGGWLATTDTVPMWGGVLISEAVPTFPASPPLTPEVALGGPVARATNLTGNGTALTGTGISVFSQAYGMINSPQSPVPLAPTYGQVMFYRFGSGARIAVAAAPSLTTLQGNPINQRVSWDFSAQQLIPYAPAYSTATISNAVWASTGGGQTTLTVNVDYTALLSAGDIIEVTGVVNTGGASTSAFNGQWAVVSVTNSTTLVIATPSTVSLGTYASGGAITAGGGALPCTVLRFEAVNCMTVSYSPATGFANWARNSSACVIQI